MGLMRKAVAVLGFGDGSKSKKSVPDDSRRTDIRHRGPLSAPQQELEIPTEFHLALNSNESCILSLDEQSWPHRNSADGRLAALLAASMRGIGATLESPGGSTSSTPRGPSCTGGGHGEAPPSLAGALGQSHPRLSSLSGRQSASNVQQLPSPVAGTATATPLARHIAKRALRKAGDSAPISLPSISSLNGGVKLRDLAPDSDEQSCGQGESPQSPPLGSGGTARPTSPSGCPISAVAAQMRRATTADMTTPLGCEDEKERCVTVVTSPTGAASSSRVSASTSAISAPWTALDATRSTSPTVLAAATAASAGTFGCSGGAAPQRPAGRERFSRVQSIPARAEYRVVEESSSDGQQTFPHPPPFPSPHPPPPRRSGFGNSELPHDSRPKAAGSENATAAATAVGGCSSSGSGSGRSEIPQSPAQQHPPPQRSLLATRGSVSMTPSRSHYYPSHLQPQQWSVEQQRRRISEVAMRPQPPSEVPLPRLRVAANAAATAAAEASSHAPEAEAPPPQSPQSPQAPQLSLLASEAIAAAAVEAQELLPSRPEPLRVLSTAPSSEVSPCHTPTLAQEVAREPTPAGAADSRCTISPVSSVDGSQATQQRPEQHSQQLQQHAISEGTSGPARSPEPPPEAAAAPELQFSSSPVRPLSPVAMAAEMEIKPEPRNSAEEKPSETLADTPMQDTVVVPEPPAAAPSTLAGFTPRPVPNPGLLHFSPAAPNQMLRSSIAWGVADYKVVRKLYAGYASSVYKATCLYSGIDVVLKAYNLAGLSNFLRNQVLRELDIHSRLRHPGVVHLMAAFREGDLLILVQEYVRGGSLDRVRRKLGGRMTEFQAMHLVLLPLLGVLSYLHGKGVVHRDIKPENLLFTETWQLKVCDYGVSICLRDERAVTRTGSREYMAPEVNICPLKRGPEDNKDNPNLAYSAAVDVWSLGALIYELLVGFTPFPGGPPSRKDGARGTAAGALAYPSGVSQGARAFVRSCLELDPADRPTIQKLLQHPWILEALEHDANSGPSAAAVPL